MAIRNVVIGSGVAGLVTALRAASHGSVLLLMRPGFRRNIPSRVDSIPASTIATLIDLGVDPRRFSDLRRHQARLVAWVSSEPELVQGPETVHVERGNLEATLFEQVVRHPDITLIPVPTERRRLLPLLEALRGCGAIVIDATGRSAALAPQRSRPRGGWHAWIMSVHAGGIGSAPDLRMAATPDGYCYRLGSGRNVTMGLVRFSISSARTVLTEFDRLRHEYAFLFEGMPPVDGCDRLRVYPASTQWSPPKQALAVGDAWLARDALSSQGIACAASDAQYAACVLNVRDAVLYRRRMEEQHASHLRSLQGILDRSRYVLEPAWTRYRQYVTAELGSTSSGLRPTAWLAGGRLIAERPVADNAGGAL